MVEQKSNSSAHASVSELKKAIRSAGSTIDPDEARRACSAFRRRLESVRDADADGGQSRENAVHAWYNTRKRFGLPVLSFTELIAL